MILLLEGCIIGMLICAAKPVRSRTPRTRSVFVSLLIFPCSNLTHNCSGRLLTKTAGFETLTGNECRNRRVGGMGPSFVFCPLPSRGMFPRDWRLSWKTSHTHLRDPVELFHGIPWKFHGSRVPQIPTHLKGNLGYL